MAAQARGGAGRARMALLFVWIPFVFVKPDFAPAADGFFDAGEKRELLADHNARRTRLAQGRTLGQPPARDMNELFWDDGLAELAHGWVRRCEWRHNPQRVQQLDPGRTRFRFEAEHAVVGENLYASTGAEATLSLFLKGHESWWDEHGQYDYEDAGCGEVCGHYTQMAWSAARYVGCAYAVCPELAGLARPQIYYACNYFPGGNVVGRRPYAQGSACASCDSDRRSCRDGLCSGCMAPAYGLCSDSASNCAELADSCPSECSLDSEQSLCRSCSASCHSCPASLLQPEARCEPVPLNHEPGA